MTKAVFISTTNIFDISGNGGVKASREHFDILQAYFGADNVLAILIVHNMDYDSLSAEKENNTVVYHRIEGNLKLLFASFWGCRVYMPWEEKTIVSSIESFYPDLVFIDFSVEGKLVNCLQKYKTVCFFHNVESDYTLNKMKTDGIRYFPAYLAAKKNDKWALRANYVMCFNNRDSIRLKQLYGRDADYIFPISLPDRFNEENCMNQYEKRLLFLGSCFGPNENGIEWFMSEVMPQIADEGIYLDIVGLGFEDKKERYSKYRNINVIGSVDKTDDYYYSHAIVVMPILYGAGMKVKTAEAMMFGRYIVASDEALEGYAVSGISDIKRCNNAEEYASAILEFFNSERSSPYSLETRALYKEFYDTSQVKEKFSEAMKIITNGDK